MGDIKITDLHKIHETDEVKDKYQIFDTKDGRVLQSMVLTRKEMEQLGDAITMVFLDESVGGGLDRKK